MNTEILQWLALAKTSIELNSAKLWPKCELNHNSIKWVEGSKYLKVIVTDTKGQRGSVFCFIDQEGNILKPAGFNKPAKGIRGHISTIDPTKLTGDTGFLYRR